jgi:hypothetical protein
LLHILNHPTQKNTEKGNLALWPTVRIPVPVLWIDPEHLCCSLKIFSDSIFQIQFFVKSGLSRKRQRGVSIFKSVPVPVYCKKGENAPLKDYFKNHHLKQNFISVHIVRCPKDKIIGSRIFVQGVYHLSRASRFILCTRVAI